MNGGTQHEGTHVPSSLPSSEPQETSSPPEKAQDDTVIDGLRPKNVLPIGQSTKIQKLPKLPAFTIQRWVEPAHTRTQATFKAISDGFDSGERNLSTRAHVSSSRWTTRLRRPCARVNTCAIT